MWLVGWLLLVVEVVVMMMTMTITMTTKMTLTDGDHIKDNNNFDDVCIFISWFSLRIKKYDKEYQYFHMHGFQT